MTDTMVQGSSQLQSLLDWLLKGPVPHMLQNSSAQKNELKKKKNSFAQLFSTVSAQGSPEAAVQMHTELGTHAGTQG